MRGRTAEVASQVVEGGRRAVRRLRAKLQEVTARANAHGERIKSLLKENGALREELKKLRAELAKKERRGKRQAAPFSKDNPKKAPKKPGRKPGEGYGKQGRRERPPKVDRVVDAEAPSGCPDCGGAVLDDGSIQEQFQTDIPPVVPLVTLIRVHYGTCQDCGMRCPGWHPLQTSSAVGAAAHQIGPNALATATHLHTVLGISYEKVSALFERHFGLTVVASTLVRAQQRLGARVETVYEELKQAIRMESIIYPDETGWRVNAASAWLWVFVSELVTIYTIRASRGSDVIDEVIGLDYAGTLGHDGWAAYNLVKGAQHQTCLDHLLRRCDTLLDSATGGAVRLPRAVQELLRDALAVRELRNKGEMTVGELCSAIDRLEERKRELVARSATYEPNRLLRDHIDRVGDQLFTFLNNPELEATNWPAEQAIRPAVVNRKVCGGNRSWTGAEALARLMTIFRTAHQQGNDAIDFLVELMRTPPGQELPSLLPGP